MADESLVSSLRGLSDPARVMRRVVTAALELLPAATGSAVELEDAGDMVYAYAAGSLEPFVGLRLAGGGSLSGLTVELGTTLSCTDTEADDRVDRDACRRVGARSMVCVPLQSATRRVGVLKVSAPHPNAFSDGDVATLADLSSFITTAISAAGDIGDSATAVLATSRSRDGRSSGAAVSGFMAHVLSSPGTRDDDAVHRVRDVIEAGQILIVHQPIFDVRTGRPVASEALSRIIAEPARPPDQWFAEAWRVGLGAELESLAARLALEDLPHLPPDCRLAINCSPSFLEHPLAGGLATWPSLDRIVLEITEHVDAEDFARTRDFLQPLRERGLRIAMDDAGNGYSSLRRMIDLAPDVIKLDVALVRGIDVDPVRRSLARAIVDFARDVGADVVAEGVEADAELETLVELGICTIQGFLLARPGPVEHVAPIGTSVRPPS